jgi:hypothetical protein
VNHPDHRENLKWEMAQFVAAVREPPGRTAMRAYGECVMFEAVSYQEGAWLMAASSCGVRGAGGSWDAQWGMVSL